MDKQSIIVEVLETLARVSKVRRENPFKARALAQAARTIDRLEGNFEELYKNGELYTIKGLGKKSIAIIDRVMKGAQRTDFISDFPLDLLDIAEIPAIGLKRAKVLRDSGVKNLNDLASALKQNQLLKIPGIGEKTQEKIAESLQHRHYRAGKIRLDQALALGEIIMARLSRRSSHIDVSIVGAARRGVALTDSVKILVAGRLSMQGLEQILKSLGVLKVSKIKDPLRGRAGVDRSGIYIKIYLVNKKYKGISSIILTSTHEEILRLAHRNKNLQALSEEEAFKALGLAFIPVELRDLKPKKRYPRLIELGDLCGAFHNHTIASDGRNSIEEMRRAAIKHGLSYISINDHSKSAFYAHGQSKEALVRQVKEIAFLNNDSYAKQCFILSGVESDIKSDGSLDYKNSILNKLDIIVASIHNQLHMNFEAMTKRLVKAALHPATTIIGHPTGRLLLRREPSQFDIDSLFLACKKNNVAIELNCHPARLDLGDKHLKRAKEHGVLIAIDADAHSARGFESLRYGISMARHAGLGPYDVLNSRPLEDIYIFLKKKKL
jgi:DNA polymerase (family 10)